MDIGLSLANFSHYESEGRFYLMERGHGQPLVIWGPMASRAERDELETKRGKLYWEAHKRLSVLAAAELTPITQMSLAASGLAQAI